MDKKEGFWPTIGEQLRKMPIAKMIPTMVLMAIVGIIVVSVGFVIGAIAIAIVLPFAAIVFAGKAVVSLTRGIATQVRKAAGKMHASHRTREYSETYLSRNDDGADHLFNATERSSGDAGRISARDVGIGSDINYDNFLLSSYKNSVVSNKVHDLVETDNNTSGLSNNSAESSPSSLCDVESDRVEQIDSSARTRR